MIGKLSELFDTEDSMYEFMAWYFELYETTLTIEEIDLFDWDKVADEIQELLVTGEYNECDNILIEINSEHTKSKEKEMLTVGYLVEKPVADSDQENCYKISNEDYYQYV